MVLSIMVAVLAFQIFSVLRTEDDNFIDPPPNPVKVAKREDLDPSPPGDPPPMPAPEAPVNENEFVEKDPFDWRERSAASTTAGAETTTLRLLRIRGTGDDLVVQIETETSRKWYRVGEAFESYEIISVDPDAGFAEIFDEASNRTRIIELED